jgi:hypothetical protein
LMVSSFRHSADRFPVMFSNHAPAEKPSLKCG